MEAHMAGRKHVSLQKRFEEKFRIVLPSECWEWLAARSSTGYGWFYYPPRNMVQAHIVAWELYRGSRKGLFVLHRCDNPACVNPKHLYLGTQRDNVADRDARKRRAPPNGAKNGRAKLTEAQVRAIIADPRWPRFIACDYNTPVSTIKHIKYRATWRHL
jgi:hypothetical protein